ncbi:MAG: shikimate kinase [Lachnospiraceae bacterium]
MKVLFLIGNAAVGKMTVGQELMKITDLRLFHGHMTIEPVIEVMGYYDGRTVNRLRDVFFEEFAASNNYGMIFTYMWAFDMKSDWDYIEHVQNIFRGRNEDVSFYFVELVATQEARVERNATENRLNHKASKRNVEESDQRNNYFDETYRVESLEGELAFEHYMKIDNTELPPEAVAQIIKNAFLL